MLKKNNIPIFAFTPTNECNIGGKFATAPDYAAYVSRYAPTIKGAGVPMSFIGGGSDIAGAVSYAQACLNAGIAFGYIVSQLQSCDWALCCYWNTNVAPGADNTIESPEDWKIPGLQIVANGLAP